MGKRYSKSDDAIIRQYVSENPSNLTIAFELASEELGRSFKAMALRWYTVLRYGEGNIATSSDQYGFVNRKNSRRTKTGNIDISERTTPAEAIVSVGKYPGRKSSMIKSLLS